VPFSPDGLAVLQAVLGFHLRIVVDVKLCRYSLRKNTRMAWPLSGDGPERPMQACKKKCVRWGGGKKVLKAGKHKVDSLRPAAWANQHVAYSGQMERKIL
jgi:hypothetical protein